jgi:hypothetical protein
VSSRELIALLVLHADRAKSRHDFRFLPDFLIWEQEGRFVDNVSAAISFGLFRQQEIFLRQRYEL